MNDVLGTILYGGAALATLVVMLLDQRYRIFPRDPRPRRAVLDLSEQETAPMLRVREPMGR